MERGNVVSLVCGGPRMTIGESFVRGDGRKFVECHWFVDQQHHWDMFDVALLVPFDSTKAVPRR